MRTLKLRSECKFGIPVDSHMIFTDMSSLKKEPFITLTLRREYYQDPIPISSPFLCAMVWMEEQHTNIINTTIILVMCWTPLGRFLPPSLPPGSVRACSAKLVNQGVKSH